MPRQALREWPAQREIRRIDLRTSCVFGGIATTSIGTDTSVYYGESAPKIELDADSRFVRVTIGKHVSLIPFSNVASLQLASET